MQHLVENLIEKIATFDEKIAKIGAKKSLFRIYRDTRFSKLKIPYITNFGAATGIEKGKEVRILSAHRTGEILQCRWSLYAGSSYFKADRSGNFYT